MHRKRKAKIIATLGPSSSSPEVIRALFDAGADVFRLNFSHGNQDDHKRRFDAIREVERSVGSSIGILQDLQGPKIRIGAMKTGPVSVKIGDIVRFRLSDRSLDGEIALPHEEVIRNILPGHALMIDDGKVRLETENCGEDYFDARVLTDGVISDRKGINLPNTELPITPLTDKDRADLSFGLSLGVDWVALSFVQKPGDIIEAHGLIQKRAGIMAKIEKPAALQDIESIVNLADAIMVARGDLGVEIPPEEVPGRQKELVRLCRLMGKPVIIATQMLESMIHSPTPTRAEASDVATAIYDSADAVMLSAESASGRYPIEAVSMMDRIIRHTEQHKLYRSIIDALTPDPENTVPHAVAAAAADVADQIHAVAIVAFTESGTTALRVARKRPEVPILCLSPNESTARRLTLLWGAHSYLTTGIANYDEMIDRAVTQVVTHCGGKTGDIAVLIAGVPFGHAGATNNLRVIRL